jgi:transposase-like protein
MDFIVSISSLTMPGTPYLRSQSLGDRLHCPVCGTFMLVVRIEPIGAHYIKRIYECSKCEHNETLIVERQTSAAGARNEIAK